MGTPHPGAAARSPHGGAARLNHCPSLSIPHRDPTDPEQPAIIARTSDTLRDRRGSSSCSRGQLAFAEHRKGGRHRDGQQRHRAQARILILAKELRRELGRARTSTSSGHPGRRLRRRGGRALSMVDGVLLLSTRSEGPMPQTRFRHQEGAGLGLKPIVVVNKGGPAWPRPDWVINRVRPVRQARRHR